MKASPRMYAIATFVILLTAILWGAFGLASPSGEVEDLRAAGSDLAPRSSSLPSASFSYVYDQRGRLTDVVAVDGSAIGYAYDDADNLQQVTNQQPAAQAG